MTKPRVVLLRGQHVNPWELRPWQLLGDRFDVACVVTGSNVFEVESVPLPKLRVHALSDALPFRRVRRVAAMAPFNRYVRLAPHLASADIVHGVELSPWPTVQAAAHKESLGYKLVVTVWETIPLGATYRYALSRPNRRRALAAADLFLPTTERARDALLLEGALAGKVEVCPPGIDLAAFAEPAVQAPPDEHIVVSPGRLVWEKGHQDVFRGVAALRQGLFDEPRPSVRLLVVGAGPEKRRLRTYAQELGIADTVEFREAVPYAEMPAVYAGASCMVLASLPTRGWEEQFGMVLAEAMAARLPIVASTSGAIPEVAGEHASYFAAGDWLGLAHALADGPLAEPPGRRIDYPRERLERFSTTAAAERHAAAYERVLG